MTALIPDHLIRFRGRLGDWATGGSHNVHVFTGGYVLDALDGPGRGRFERHLRHCPSCAAEIRGFREVAARLAMAAASPPPADLRGQVLTAARQTRRRGRTVSLP